SRGNYAEIEKFLHAIPDTQRALGMTLLDRVSLKDLRDSKANILRDHLAEASKYLELYTSDQELFENYLLNPRVATEMLIAYRDFLLNAFSNEELNLFRENPAELVEWIKNTISIANEENYYETPITPVGVFELKVADEFSTKIFAVAALRTLGYPARLEPGTEYVQYWQTDNWVTVYFAQAEKGNSARGKLVLLNDSDNSIAPKYHIHFSLAKFEEGKYHTLHYEWEKPLSDFADGVELDAGFYMLVVGNRQPGGIVLHEQEFFFLEEGQSLTKIIGLRTNDQEPEVLAQVDLSATYQGTNSQELHLAVRVGDQWMVLAWIDPDKEPTKHTFQDLGVLKDELDELDLPFTFIIPENKLTDSFRNNDYSGLPDNHLFVFAKELNNLQALSAKLDRDLASQLPVFIITNLKGEVIYLSSGYKIGIGEEIVKVVR
ncbi:MAG: hypothetical protein HN936_18005, partial [Bacteroidetes bacterium]|nr:hypothetical protein [Bacteroidota bacterium]